MSKLINAVKAELTGRRFPEHMRLPAKILDVSQNYSELSYNTVMEYDVRVDLHTRTRAQYSGREGYGDVKKQACEYLAYHVFGEFREHIVEIRQALCNGDVKEAHKWLDDMEKRMFDV